MDAHCRSLLLVTRHSHMADGGWSIVAAVMHGRAGVGPCVHASERHVRVNGKRSLGVQYICRWLSRKQRRRFVYVSLEILGPFM